jgi:hypothetical protein
MSGFNYTGLASTATRLINKFGGDVTLRIKTEGTYNPITGANTDTFADTVVQGVKLNFVNSDIDGTLIRTGDVKVLIDGLFALTKDDKIIIGTDQYEIIKPMPLAPGDTRLVTTLQCRR